MRKNIKLCYFTGTQFHTVDVSVPSAEDDEAIEKFRNILYNVGSQAIIDFEFEGGSYEKKKALRRS